MASNLEIQITQKRYLYQLLSLKKANFGIAVKGLDELINLTEAEMDQADVSYVEKKIAQMD